MNSINKENFRIIRKAIENDKLAIFIGSAVSYDSKLPSWGDLIDLLKSSLDNPRTDDYLKIAEHYYLQYGKNSYYSRIKEFFPDNSQHNKIHELILSLKPKYIVTTNWDDLLEKAIFDNGELYFRVANDHELASSPGSKLLIKMHGDINLRNIVFKESDYLSYSDNFPLIENFIKSLFSTHVVLFIGYSISDYNLNQILSWVRNRTQDAPPAFTILTENSITLSEANYLREKGVYPILNDESLEYREEYPELSIRSKKVATLLESIVRPDRKETLEVLLEIYNDISDWELVHPVNLVRFIKDRFEIASVNKIYFDSSENAITYHVSKYEFSRVIFRPIRKVLRKILSKTPIDSINIKGLSD